MASNATKFGTVALGSAIAGAVIALVANNSLVTRGNLVFDPTANATPKTQVLNSAGTALIDLITYSTAKITFERPVSGTTNGVQSGSVLQADGLTRRQEYGTSLTASGGVWNYSPLALRSPLSSTGYLISLSLECGNVPNPFTFSGSFVKAKTLAVTQNIVRFSNASVVSGSLIRTTFSGNYLVWNPADILKFSVRTTVPTTSQNSCKVYPVVVDKFGT